MEDNVESFNLITNEGALIKLEWLIPYNLLNKSSNITCSAHIHKANSKLFKTMIPVSVNTSDSKGAFKCGTIKSNETSNLTEFLKESMNFMVPTNITWRKCVLEFSVNTDSGNYSQCADILIESRTTLQSMCETSCSKTKGKCVNGECQCFKGYHGKYCQYTSHSKKTSTQDYSDTIQILFIIILLVLVILGGSVGLYYWRQSKEELKQETIRRLEFENEKTLERIKNYEYGSFSKRVIV